MLPSDRTTSSISQTETYVRIFKYFTRKRKYTDSVLGSSNMTSEDDVDPSLRDMELKFDEDIDTPISPAGSDIPEWHIIETPDEPDRDTRWTDGTDEHPTRSKPAVAAIFIHAGAGYHSTANERLHLNACSDAAKAAMKFLKMGAPATQAVEAAIRVLEDKEITNAGYGSNLAIDGMVECDATLVDHLGRSGACGATPNIKNPISLARKILNESHKPLTLRRVPPNLLVGRGAKDFAHEHGITLIPNEWLVSSNAKDRYIRWKEDLDRANAKISTSASTEPKSPTPEYLDKSHQKSQRDHANAILTGTWNEGQPDSPGIPATPSGYNTSGSPLKPMSPASTPAVSPGHPTGTMADRSPLNYLAALTGTSQRSPNSPRSDTPSTKRAWRKVGSSDGTGLTDSNTSNDAIVGDRTASPTLSPAPCSSDFPAVEEATGLSDPPTRDLGCREDEDRITDTVGAIAIDQWGNMAAGSSSGGIGMKHRGRVGPAALVGVGTAIIPANDADKDRTVVGAVTSGTGEHMATTMASQKCAERLYYGTRRGKHGEDVEEHEESNIMESFVVNDFQNHPGVLQSASASAIGVMAIKQTKKGYYLYFAHNTDSFALASMCSSDRQPHCVMSRLPDGTAGVAQGARKIRAE